MNPAVLRFRYSEGDLQDLVLVLIRWQGGTKAVPCHNWPPLTLTTRPPKPLPTGIIGRHRATVSDLRTPARKLTFNRGVELMAIGRCRPASSSSRV